MAELTFIVPKEWHEKKLEPFLRQQHGVSATTIKNAKKVHCGLSMNGEHIRTIDPIYEGAVIKVLTDIEKVSYLKSETPVDVLFEDDDIIIFDKPYGLSCHPSKGNDYETLANVFAARESTEGLTFRSIGRLDKDTSGVQLCAKNAYSGNILNRGERPKKQYLAILKGKMPNNQGTVNAPIAREVEGERRRCVREDGQQAITHYKTLLSGENISLVALKLETGRTHQIRVHMAHLGFPLIGDELYGGDTELLFRHGLHCQYIKLKHPKEDKYIFTHAPIPLDMMMLLQKEFSEEDIKIAVEKEIEDAHFNDR